MGGPISGSVSVDVGLSDTSFVYVFGRRGFCADVRGSREIRIFMVGALDPDLGCISASRVGTVALCLRRTTAKAPARNYKL